MHTPMPLVGHSLVLFAFSIVLLFLCAITSLMRFFVRLYLVRAFGWDDGLMILGLSFYVVMTACVLGSSVNGLGHHFAEFPSLGLYRTAIHWYWVASETYVWSSAFSKCSIAAALLRISGVIRLHRYILWGALCSIFIATFLFAFTFIFVCFPTSYFWTRVVPNTTTGHCAASEVLSVIAYIYTSLSVLTDLTLGILPMFLVYRLQMNLVTKFAVGALLSLGLVYEVPGSEKLEQLDTPKIIWLTCHRASVGTIIRIPFLTDYDSKDLLYALFRITICTTIENASVIIAGNLMTLRPLFRCIRGRSIQSDGRYDGRRYPDVPNSSVGLTHLKITNFGPSTYHSVEDPNKRLMTTTIAPAKNRVYPNQNHEGSEELLNPWPSNVRVQETFTVESRDM